MAEFGDTEQRQQDLGVLDDPFAGFEEKAIDRFGGGLDLLDLGEVERVTSAFVPIGLAVLAVPDQPLRLDGCLPAVARAGRVPLHRAQDRPPPKLRPLESEAAARHRLRSRHPVDAGGARIIDSGLRREGAGPALAGVTRGRGSNRRNKERRELRPR